LIGAIGSHSVLSASFGFADAALIAGTIAAIAAANVKEQIAIATETGSVVPVSKSKLLIRRAPASAAQIPVTRPTPVN
jgi:hypothetical protein